MRTLLHNQVITVKAMKRHREMILLENGRNYLIHADNYTDNIPFIQWRYWILKRKGNKFKVLKSIPE